jgi:ABC transporter substrate binding protein (PQQ-dependent alcohol dehydrogenase system)
MPVLRLLAALLLAAAGTLLSPMVAGRAAAQQAPAAEQAPIEITWLALAQKRTVPSTFLDQPPADEGVQGARVALADNMTTGRFTGQNYKLDEITAPDAAKVLDAFRTAAGQGKRLFVTDLPADLLVQVADLPEAKDALIIDATDTDDSLRAEKCRRNVLHTLPSRAMLADALMQYLVIKNWRNILLVVGREPEDIAFGDALRNSAKKFRLKVVADKPWTFVAGARRTDTGHFAIEAEVARFTQGIDYDVLVVADEAGNFGDELPYHTTDPHVVAGTAGMVPSAWSRPFEQWGATQMQLRFLKLTNRWMTDRDYGAWMAVRAIGEAATRANTSDPGAIATYMRGKDFELAAFKGSRLTFRSWDGQLRQPVLLSDPHQLISVSPQPGFLHQVSELDTLGVDQPETKCHF